MKKKCSYANYAPDWLEDPPRDARKHEVREIRVVPKLTGEQYHEMMMKHLPIVKAQPREKDKLREVERDSRRINFGGKR